MDLVDFGEVAVRERRSAAYALSSLAQAARGLSKSCRLILDFGIQAVCIALWRLTS